VLKKVTKLFFSSISFFFVLSNSGYQLAVRHCPRRCIEREVDSGAMSRRVQSPWRLCDNWTPEQHSKWHWSC